LSNNNSYKKTYQNDDNSVDPYDNKPDTSYDTLDDMMDKDILTGEKREKDNKPAF
jgi:hypothetical protein